MADKVIPLGNITRLDMPPDRILENAVGNMSGVVLIGWEKETAELYFASSIADGAEVLWLLECAKRELMEAKVKP